MNNIDVRSKTEAAPGVEPVDMKLEVVLFGVSDVDRAKAFSKNPARILPRQPHDQRSHLLVDRRSTWLSRVGPAGRDESSVPT
jgi:hypothetical protein